MVWSIVDRAHEFKHNSDFYNQLYEPLKAYLEGLSGTYGCAEARCWREVGHNFAPEVFWWKAYLYSNINTDLTQPIMMPGKRDDYNLQHDIFTKKLAAATLSFDIAVSRCMALRNR